MGNRRDKRDRGPVSWGLVVSGFVLGAAVLILFFKFSPYFKPAPLPQVEKTPVKPPEEEKKPVGPVVEKEEKPAPQPPYPMVAIVIDDMGQDLKKLKELFELDAPITIAILPYL
ncbi:MAG: divergent polysaccharide deacetylase family protein, partial [Deltaproteobacteria bacterium]